MMALAVGLSGRTPLYCDFSTAFVAPLFSPDMVIVTGTGGSGYSAHHPTVNVPATTQ